MPHLLKFDLALKELPVEITDSSGVVQRYTLRQLTGAQRDAYWDETSKRIRPEAKPDRPAFTSMSGMQAHLISLSLINAEGNPVPPSTIQKWPASGVQGLFTAAQELSGLGKETSKNVPLESVPAGSD
jgi:hypothetical protein